MTAITNLPPLSTSTNLSTLTSNISFPVINTSGIAPKTEQITLGQFLTVAKGPSGPSGPRGLDGTRGPSGPAGFASISFGSKIPTSAGIVGQISYDTNYVYFCVAANTWVRLGSSSTSIQVW